MPVLAYTCQAFCQGEDGNRLIKFNGDTMTYDDDGNMTSRYIALTGESHRYVWNALGQLDSAIVVSAIDTVTGL